MNTVTLTVLPSGGMKSVSFDDGETLATFIARHSLGDKNIIVDDNTMSQSQWSSVVLRSGMEIYATKSVKGNF